MRLWNEGQETDISSYTTRFNELVLLCPGMVPTEQKKIKDLYQWDWNRGQARAEREADNKKRKWENFQGGSSSSSGGGNSNSNGMTTTTPVISNYNS
ncbi:hypothetical protein Tco_0894924 [Tanacetum coccineum]|uniref:Retrotransposon gag domain-containing protein n=1 Tax=Tanacetum coccineum TaxID=301880 RepID=A0ABQ5CFH8_9ASTR